MSGICSFQDIFKKKAILYFNRIKILLSTSSLADLRMNLVE